MFPSSLFFLVLGRIYISEIHRIHNPQSIYQTAVTGRYRDISFPLVFNCREEQVVNDSARKNQD